jgi:methyl-accepting chemotaxis protein
MILKNLKLRNKIFVGFSIPLVIILFITFNVYLKTKTIISNFDNLVQSETVISDANLLIKSMVDIETGERGFLISGDEDFLTPYRNGHINFEKSIKQIEQSVKNQPEQLARLKVIEEKKEEWNKNHNEVLINLRRDQIAGKSKMSVAQIQAIESQGFGRKSVKVIRDSVIEFVTDQENLVKLQKNEAHLASNSLINFTIFSLIASLFACFSISVLIGNAISKPINKLVEKASEIAKGILNSDKDMEFDSEDEVGLLARSFMKMSENIQNQVDDTNILVQAAMEGNLSARADSTKHEGDFKKVLDGINDTLNAVTSPISEVVTVLQKMSEGDFSVEVDGSYKGDHAILQNALNSSLRSINVLISQVHATTEQIVESSEQVSATSQSLSQGATEQASSMEEITSSMQEIGSQVSQNAENANKANQLSTHAMNSAENGDEQMKELMNAMTEINVSSKNISKIIKVIDEIAFQTNLLALNAAVEAARAGRNGKGFAVVAEEVRNLAARSSAAAKETSEMIEGAVKKAENGATIAEKTLVVLKEIKVNSTKVADIVSEIASASNEQAQGVSQVNTGLVEVDQVTQQNTASSEECASASEELFGQCEELIEMLTRFKLREHDIDYKVQKKDIHGKRSHAHKSNGHGNGNKKALVNAGSKNKDVSIKLDDPEFGKF